MKPSYTLRQSYSRPSLCLSTLCMQLSYSCYHSDSFICHSYWTEEQAMFCQSVSLYPGQYLVQNRYSIHHLYGYRLAQFTILLILLLEIPIFSQLTFLRKLGSHEGKDISQPHLIIFGFSAHGHMNRSWIQDVSVISVSSRRNSISF